MLSIGFGFCDVAGELGLVTGKGDDETGVGSDTGGDDDVGTGNEDIIYANLTGMFWIPIDLLDSWNSLILS